LQSSGISAQTSPDAAAIAAAMRRFHSTERPVGETATPASTITPGAGAKARRQT
jgi:hypothetical protein